MHAYIVYLCAIYNSNRFHSFIFKLCIMIVHPLKMCTDDAGPEQCLVLFQKCMTQECVKESAYILNKMETNIDPCTDFYQYACGKWEKNTPIPPSKSKYGSFSHLSDIIKDTVKEVCCLLISISVTLPFKYFLL